MTIIALPTAHFDGIHLTTRLRRRRQVPNGVTHRAVDNRVTIAASEDRAGPKRLPRHCARSAFASERLSWDHERQGRCTVPKPMPRDNGRWVVIDGDLRLIKASHWSMGATDRGC